VSSARLERECPSESSSERPILVECHDRTGFSVQVFWF
jgi:hypothetical protein